jgi:deazaflavin-dependent oxidoreductase (nitroreductase family)
MSTLNRLITTVHRWLYRQSGGRIGSRLAGIDHLLLTTTGKKSGLPRQQPLACFEDSERLLIVASNGGSDRAPAWYGNLCATPEVEVQRGRTRERRVARTANPEERARLWPGLVEQNSFYGTYEKRTSREIPVVILEPVPGRQASR